jgi:hypothetical protein
MISFTGKLYSWTRPLIEKAWLKITNAPRLETFTAVYKDIMKTKFRMSNEFGKER